MREIKHPQAELQVYPDIPTLSRAVADEFIRVGRAALARRGGYTVALAGGSTPRASYALLAQDERGKGTGLAWDKVEVFFGDERPVPPEHLESNFRMAQEALLSHVMVKPQRVHRIRGELEATPAAAEYESAVKTTLVNSVQDIPSFDLILLGMGPDGHTASLFPGSPALQETTRLVCANWVEKLGTSRITFTFPLLNAAAQVLFMVAGADKADMLRRVLKGEPSGATYPAQRVQPTTGRLLWMLDEAAAQQL
jgi:6-phosphogluconolactonase